MKFTEIEASDPFEEYIANTSPILDDKEADYLVRMRKTIKDSFAQKIAVLKGETTLYNYDTDSQTLRAKSHLYRIPSLLTPQLSFEIADKITQQHHKLLGRSLSKVKAPTTKCAVPATYRVHAKFSHRTALKELENWFKTKLSEPDANSDIYEYKNAIVGLGMKELIRILKTRCHEQGQLLQDMWETTWKICQDVIIFLNKELGSSRKSIQSELASIEKVYVQKLSQSNNTISQLNSQITKMQQENNGLQAKMHKYLRSSKELKAQLAVEVESANRYEKEYMRVLEENLALQMSNLDKREWVKKMYKSIKNYKARIAEGMKSIIKNVVTERSRFDEDLLELDFDNIDFENVLITQPHLMETEASSALQKEFKTFNRYAQTTSPILLDSYTEPNRIQTQNTAVQTEIQTETIQVQTTQDWISSEQLAKNNAKLKRQKEKLENQLKGSHKNSRISMRGKDHLSGLRVSHKSSLKGSLSEIDHTNTLAQNNDQKSMGRQSNDLKIQSFYQGESKASQVNQEDDNRLSTSKSKSSQGQETFRNSHHQQFFQTTNWQNGQFENIPQLPERLDSSSPSRMSEVIPKSGKSTNRDYDKENDVTYIPGLSKFNFRLSLGTGMLYNGSSIIDYMSPLDSQAFPPITQEVQAQTSVSDDSHKCTTSREKLEQSDKFQRLSDPKMFMSGIYFNQPSSEIQEMTTHIEDSQANGGIFLNKQQDKKEFFQKSIMYRRCFSKPELVSPPSEPEQFSISEFELFTKLQKYNFQLLNRIKYLKFEQGYKDLLKNIGTQTPTSDKKMELSIDKGLAPVLVDLLKYYKKLKILKPHSAKIFLKNLQPLPIIIIRKFTQKYGVKSIAIKHLKQILTYLTILRTRNPRYGILYLLLFSDLKIYSSDTLILFITLLNALDGQHTMLKQNTEKDKSLENVELKDISIVEACQPYFNEPPERPTDANTVGQYILFVLQQLLNEQSNKISNVYWIFNGFASSNLRLQHFYRFVLSLNLDFQSQLQIMKELLLQCDSRTADGRYEMTEEKFVTFMTLNSHLTYPNLMQIFSRYEALYIYPINLQNLAKIHTNKNYQKRLIRYIRDMIVSNNTDCQDVMLAWKYIQFEEIQKRMKQIIRQLIGKFTGFEDRSIKITTGGRDLFEVQ